MHKLAKLLVIIVVSLQGSVCAGATVYCTTDLTVTSQQDCIRLTADSSTTKNATKTRSENIGRSFWLGAGLGGSSLGFISGFGNISVELPHQLVITGYAQAESQSLYATNTQVFSYGFLAGKIFKQRFSFVTVSAGVALVDIENGTSQYNGFFNYTTTFTHQYTVGIPVFAQFHFVALQAIGIGVSGCANLNTIQTTAGINVSMALGRLTTHKGKN